MSLDPTILSCEPELRPPYHPDQQVMPGLKYGRPDELLSPAYWSMRCATADTSEIDFVNRHGSLAEEIGFCLLGGFGVTLEVATAFFLKLKDKGVFEPGHQVSEHHLLQLLDSPAVVHGRPQRYRFPNQRARRIAKAMVELPRIELDSSDAVGFRDKIQELDGVGPKTASWITRNWLDTDEVAILDIHVLRAGWFLGIFVMIVACQITTWNWSVNSLSSRITCMFVLPFLIALCGWTCVPSDRA